MNVTSYASLSLFLFCFLTLSKTRDVFFLTVQVKKSGIPYYRAMTSNIQTWELPEVAWTSHLKYQKSTHYSWDGKNKQKNRIKPITINNKAHTPPTHTQAHINQGNRRWNNVNEAQGVSESCSENPGLPGSRSSNLVSDHFFLFFLSMGSACF